MFPSNNCSIHNSNINDFNNRNYVYYLLFSGNE